MAASTTAERGREVRRRLLAAAVELIPERGWTAVSTRVLAERAGVASGVVHYHFASVQALLSEAALEAMRGLIDQIGLALRHSRTPGGALEVMVGFLFDYDGRDATSLLFAETYLAATRDGDLRASLSQIIDQFRHMLADLLATQHVPAPEATAAVLAAAVDGIMLHRGLGPGLDASDVTPVLHRLLAPAEHARPRTRKAGETP